MVATAALTSPTVVASWTVTKLWTQQFKLRTWAMTHAPGVALVPLTIDANAGDGRPELC
jgi:hypothetical protein